MTAVKHAGATSTWSVRRISSGRAFLGFLGFVSIFVIWDLITRFGLTTEFVVGSPAGAFRQLLDQIASGTLFTDLAASVRAFAIALVLAHLVGVPGGMLAGWYPKVEYAFDPFFWLLYSAPKLAFYPLFIIWFGLGSPTVIALAFLFAVFPIYEGAYTGVRNVDSRHVLASVSFGADQRTLFRKVILPSSIPALVGGARLGMGRGLVGVVIGELFGGTEGLGFRLEVWAAQLRTNDYFAIVLVVAFVGVVTSALLGRLERAVDYRGQA